MSYRDLPPAIQAINQALDRKRSEHQFANDIELAQHLLISDRLLSFWRNGRLTRTQAALAAVLTGDQSILGTK